MQTLIHTPTPNLQQSLDFYARLGYTVLSAANPTLVSDGKAIIEINPDRTARAGLKLYRESWSDVLPALGAITNLVHFEGGVLVSDASGVWIYLVDGPAPASVADAALAPSTLGNFMGLSLEATDVARSRAIYEALGFTLNPNPYMVQVISPDGLGIALMEPLGCPHLYFNPSLTYFNGKANLEVIAKVRAAGIPITEEITVFNAEGVVDNIILRDPGGYGFFVFSD